MPEWGWAVVGAAVLSLAVLAVLRRPLRRLSRDIQVERARELFRLQRERLELLFLPAAAATGKPRGLRWVECTFEDEVLFARDRRSRELLALAGVTVRFEAVAGGDMEGLPAVGDLRSASAVFFFHRGKWQTVGKAVFNMNPGEAVHHFRNRYERVGADDVVAG
jgi:hypothetical protein